MSLPSAFAFSGSTGSTSTFGTERRPVGQKTAWPRRRRPCFRARTPRQTALLRATRGRAKGQTMLFAGRGESTFSTTLPCFTKARTHRSSTSFLATGGRTAASRTPCSGGTIFHRGSRCRSGLRMRYLIPRTYSPGRPTRETPTDPDHPGTLCDGLRSTARGFGGATWHSRARGSRRRRPAARSAVGATRRGQRRDRRGGGAHLSRQWTGVCRERGWRDRRTDAGVRSRHSARGSAR